MALQFPMVAMGAALRALGQLQAGDDRLHRDRASSTWSLAPFLIFGWGTGSRSASPGAAISSLVAVVIGVVWMATYFVAEGSCLHFVLADMKPRIRALEADARDRLCPRGSSSR